MSIYKITSNDYNNITVNKNLLNNGKKESLVKVYLPGCPACQNIENDWNKFEKYVKNKKLNIQVVSINANVLNYFEPHFKVEFVPTILFLNKNGTIKSNYNFSEINLNLLKKFLTKMNKNKSVKLKKDKLVKRQNKSLKKKQV